MTANAIVTSNFHGPTVDIEAQRPAARSYNPNVTRAKMAAMAVVGTAGLLATSLLASADPLEMTGSAGRSLTGQGCSKHQQVIIERWRKAAIGNCIGMGAGAAVGVLACIFNSSTLAYAAGAGIGAAANGAVMSAIVYGVKKRNC
jgi:hypothetical protein